MELAEAERIAAEEAWLADAPPRLHGLAAQAVRLFGAWDVEVVRGNSSFDEPGGIDLTTPWPGGGGGVAKNPKEREP